MFDYKIIRSARKTIGVYVKNGVVEARVPNRATKADVEKVILQHQDRIQKMLDNSLDNVEKRDSFTLYYGDCVTYLGKEYTIAVKSGNRIGFADNAFFVPPDLSSDEIIHACVQIYKMLAKRDLTVKVLDFAKRMGVMPTAVKINSATSRWGSCSSRKSLNFSWRLIMADNDAVDYVVVHELAHITEMNHSSQFWAIVGSVIPDYKEQIKSLKELQKRQNGEKWE